MVVIILVAMSGGVAYFLLRSPDKPSETIKIGFVGDLNTPSGNAIVQSLALAAEQVNAEGGVLGRNFEIVTQDDESGTYAGEFDVSINALRKLISVDEADFIISYAGPGLAGIQQEIAFEHKKILIHGGDPRDEMSQKVLDDYDRYKYYFKLGSILNRTTNCKRAVASIVACRELTGFNKVAVLMNDLGIGEAIFAPDVAGLREFGFDVVYADTMPLTTVDYTGYFAQAEAAGAEILYPILFANGIPFIKEYYERQSPMVIWGPSPLGIVSNVWKLSEGKCEYVTTSAGPTTIEYPATSRTLSTLDAFEEVWSEELGIVGVAAYDFVRFVLPDALNRAETTETDAVIKALEETDTETSRARRFMFTSSHDIMEIDPYLENPSEAYWLEFFCQWQDGKLVPVFPLEIMEEEGATYMFPDWSGPWD
ncbi:MAG: ABC transporter substrate-binding protein [Candidatus Bathyarchaeota archaeon]|nr:ABC transporter substrate-binding protein [Candidatus Bathyarchaeota archaeon]